MTVRALSEDAPGERWAASARELWPHYHTWFLREGEWPRATYLASERALRLHMPELWPLYQALVELAGGSDLVARFLSQYRPPPYATGCSQAVWTHGAPLLVRNYDYAPALWEARIWRTGWLGRSVLGNSDCLWGLLDGVNDAGLSLSLAFGGRRVVGDGFGIPLILRYVLQVCSTTAEALEVLCRVPCHMAYTVTTLDTACHHATVYLSPDRPAVVTSQLAATNHQAEVEWPEHALSTASAERQQLLEVAAHDPTLTREAFLGRFLSGPVYSTRYAKAAGTLFTACYAPAERSLTMVWPQQRWHLPLHGPVEGQRTVLLGTAGRGQDALG